RLAVGNRVEHAVRQRVPSTHPDHRLTANTKPPPRRKTQWDNPTTRSGTQPRSHPSCCHTTKLTTETTVDRWIHAKAKIASDSEFSILSVRLALGGSPANEGPWGSFASS